MCKQCDFSKARKMHRRSFRSNILAAKCLRSNTHSERVIEGKQSVKCDDIKGTAVGGDMNRSDAISRDHFLYFLRDDEQIF